MAKEVIGKIMETYAVLSDDGGRKLIYASIAWNDRAPKDEIRQVWTDEDGKEHLGKGIAVTDAQVKKLIKAFQKKIGEPITKDEVTVANVGVNFNQIFEEAVSISDLRAAGNPTEDGFIRLSYKDGMSPHKLKSTIVRKVEKE